MKSLAGKPTNLSQQLSDQDSKSNPDTSKLKKEIEDKLAKSDEKHTKEI
jgi:hypothetical protein